MAILTSTLAATSAMAAPANDWLIQPAGFVAKVERHEKRNEIALSNGLVRRTFRLGPNLATVGYDNLVSGEPIIRAIRPEAFVTIDGRKMAVGGLSGQANQAYFTEDDLARLTADPGAMRFVGMATGQASAPLEWKKVRHHAPGAAWPPKGVSVRFDFELPPAPAGELPAEVLWQDDFLTLDPAWTVTSSKAAERISFQNEGKAGEVYALQNTHVFATRALPSGTTAVELTLDAGTDRSTSWGPGLGLVFGSEVVKVNLRPGDRGEHGHFELRANGAERLATVKELAAADGGLATEAPYRLRARVEKSQIRWEVAAQREPARWHTLFTTPRPREALTAVRVGKTDRQGGASDAPSGAAEEGEWGRSRLLSLTAYGAAEAPRTPTSAPASTSPASSALRVSVHYEMYNGIPLLAKWLTIENRSQRTVRVDRLTTEVLAMVEHANDIETRTGVSLPKPQSLIVDTDMAFGGFSAEQANRHVVHFRPDKSYTTQVNYLLQMPCLLEVEPLRGPAQEVAPGQSFRSFRTYELAMDSTERERRGLAYRRMMRTLAPWTTENPLMMHMRVAEPDKVSAAIDQCAEVGFEMLILSFGSGFNAEDDSPEYLARWKQVADYARAKGIEIGCYSLYSSRRIGGGHDMVTPPGEPATHGSIPAITSTWGQEYIRKLRAIFDATGFSVFELDGPYPGDTDVTPRPPLQRGIDDSQWAHWEIWSDFYRTLRSKGVYINQPDYHFLQGGSKTSMGYREVNWSLPRAQQVIHTRQNIFDGTWEKSPSIGWMFVPLSEYQGGGAAATIEPLDEHIGHYERMMLSNLALGVQACYRGPRLYDTPRVRDMVRKNVAWFKAHRDILESDLIHLRRANGRTLDGMLHVNPRLETPAMLVAFNPTDHEVTETWDVPLYYSGLSGKVTVTDEQGRATTAQADASARIRQEIRVPANSLRWIRYRKAAK